MSRSRLHKVLRATNLPAVARRNPARRLLGIDSLRFIFVELAHRLLLVVIVTHCCELMGFPPNRLEVCLGC